MSSYIINVKNTSDDEGTIIADVGFSYSDNLNDMNDAQLKISGTGETKRGLFEIGSEVKIYRNTTLAFHGIINGISYLDGGGISADILGYESWLGKENGEYASSPYTTTASATIVDDIIGESSYFIAGTVETGADIDFRLESTSRLWNALSSLIKITDQDIGIDYANSEVDILDHKGSSTSVATLNDGIQMGDVVVRQAYPIANDVRVFGKGDGDNQIKSDKTSYGQNQGSKDTYGTIRKDYIDSSVVSVNEANLLADNLVAKWKDPVKVYGFDVLNPNTDVVSGDVITLNASTKGLSAEEVRVVSIQRGVDASREFLILEVTNKEYSTKSRSINQKIAEISKREKDQQTYMQGTTNILTFPALINANNSVPLKINAQIPSSFIYDEAGNRRVSSFTLDYDVDPYRKGVGGATSDNSTTGAGITNVNSVTNAGITNAASNSNAGISNANKGSSDNGYFFGNYLYIATTTINNTWQTLANTINIGSYNYDFHAIFVNIQIKLKNLDITEANTWVFVRAKNTTDNTYWPDSNGLQMMSGLKADSSAHPEYLIPSTFLMIPYNWTNKTYVLQYRIADGADFGRTDIIDDAWIRYSYMGLRGHTHSNTFNDASHTNSNTFNDANHTNANTFDDANHNHDVSIGDSVSDAEAVNASQVSIYVDWYNSGTSTWDNKHSILNTGKTLDTDVDISNGNTLPDAAGFWRARIITDNATPDLLQGIIKLNHQLDT